MKCELIKNCTFFNTATGESLSCILAQLKSKYCENNPTLCARRRVAQALGHEKVPVELHPDHLHHAIDLIAKRHTGD